MLKNLALKKFFSNGPAMIVAIDHGFFDGPIPGLDNVKTLADKISPDIDAVLLSPGMFRYMEDKLFSHRNAPQAVIRINWSTIYCFNWDYHSGDTVVAFSPEEIQEMGAPFVLISLSLKTGSEAVDAENVRIFADLCSQAHALGMPVIGEYFPVNDEALSEDEMFEEIKIGTRILFELGADVIKTFHTRDFDKVVNGCPVPILTLGGKRAPSDLAALEMAETQIKSGAAGIVFGRNVIQSPKPIELQQAILDVLKNNMPAKEAAAKYGLK
jgi:DhnA family fructose-bisphosphate aldolase class Ia